MERGVAVAVVTAVLIDETVATDPQMCYCYKLNF